MNNQIDLVEKNHATKQTLSNIDNILIYQAYIAERKFTQE